jgi:NitT/TauT family transport system ATP-binding protein/nitrate/nitrite transport system substrate-binding protein
MGDAATMRLGLLRLTDAAPVVLAAERRLFAQEGADVTLQVEPSWANVADKLAYGLIDAAVLPPPLGLAMEFGLRPAATRLIVPLSLSLNGNSIVLADRLAAALFDGATGLSPRDSGARLAARIAGGLRPRLAVVHRFSTHDLLLRYWLAACGIDPERQVDLPVIPPPDMPEALRSGRIDGFCAGAPWGAEAVRLGAGRTVVRTSAIWRNHPEKCLALRADWAARHPGLVQAVLRALLRAGTICDAPAEAAGLAALLAQPNWVGVAPEILRHSLPGGLGEDADRSVFAAHAAGFPWRSHARWFAGQMARWIALPEGAADLAAAAYRPDLYAEAAQALGIPVPLDDAKMEGGHAADWLLPALPRPLAMQADLLFDGARFAPDGNLVAPTSI